MGRACNCCGAEGWLVERVCGNSGPCPICKECAGEYELPPEAEKRLHCWTGCAVLAKRARLAVVSVELEAERRRSWALAEMVAHLETRVRCFNCGARREIEKGGGSTNALRYPEFVDLCVDCVSKPEARSSEIGRVVRSEAVKLRAELEAERRQHVETAKRIGAALEAARAELARVSNAARRFLEEKDALFVDVAAELRAIGQACEYGGIWRAEIRRRLLAIAERMQPASPGGSAVGPWSFGVDNAAGARRVYPEAVRDRLDRQFQGLTPLAAHPSSTGSKTTPSPSGDGLQGENSMKSSEARSAGSQCEGEDLKCRPPVAAENKSDREGYENAGAKGVPNPVESDRSDRAALSASESGTGVQVFAGGPDDCICATWLGWAGGWRPGAHHPNCTPSTRTAHRERKEAEARAAHGLIEVDPAELRDAILADAQSGPAKSVAPGAAGSDAAKEKKTPHDWTPEEHRRAAGEMTQGERTFLADLARSVIGEPTLRDTLLSGSRAVAEAMHILGRAAVLCDEAAEPVLSRWVREASEKLHEANELAGRVAIIVGLPDSADESQRLRWVVSSPWGDIEDAKLLRRHGLLVLLEVPYTSAPSWWSLATLEPVDTFDPNGPRAGWTLEIEKDGGK